jgi:hypothetical protein
MLTKSIITVAAVVVLGAASAALAADNEQHGGFRELGAGGAVTDGVNPVDHPSLSGVKPLDPVTQTERREPSDIQTEGRAPSEGARKQDNYGPESGKQ